MSSSSWCVTPSTAVGSSHAARLIVEYRVFGMSSQRWATETAGVPRRCVRPILAPSVSPRDQPRPQHEREAKDRGTGR